MDRADLNDEGRRQPSSSKTTVPVPPPATTTSLKRERKIANLACQNCRRRRVRCTIPDEGTSAGSCSYCLRMGITCEWASQDRRRETVNDLRQRLKEVVKQQQHQPTQICKDAMSLSTAPSVEDSIKKRRLSSISPQSKPIPLTEEKPGGKLQREPGSTALRPEILDTLACDDTGTIRAVPPLSAHALSTGIAQMSRDRTSTSGTQRQTLASPTQTTGGRQLPDLPYNFLQAAAARITDLPIGTDIRVVDHLLHTYFCWHHTAFPIMSLRAFGDSFRNQGPYYSPLLLNALLALASHLSDWDVLTRHAEPGTDFFAEAKKLLEDELSRPTLCTIQALCLMAKREVYCGRGLRGGLYFSQAGRLVLDLGLHLDPTPLVEKEFLSEMDSYVRCRAFWGIYSMDMEFGAILGRPGTLVDVHHTCPRAPRWHEDDLHWRDSVATGLISPLSEHEPAYAGSLFIGDFCTDISLRHEGLARLVYRNGDKPLSLEMFNELVQSLQEMFTQLENCDDKADPARRPSPPFLTARLFAEDQTIIFCRPFALTDEYGSSVRQRARELCLQAAQNILETMELFRASHPSGLRSTLNGHIHSLLYAACAFLYEVLLAETEPIMAWKEQSLGHLHRVIHLLESMSGYRPAAAQAVKNLVATLSQAEARQATRTETSTETLPSQSVESEIDLDELLAWPADGLDAFLFSSQQYPDSGPSANAGDSAGYDWLSTAMLFQTQGHWSSFVR